MSKPPFSYKRTLKGGGWSDGGRNAHKSILWRQFRGEAISAMNIIRLKSIFLTSRERNLNNSFAMPQKLRWMLFF